MTLAPLTDIQLVLKKELSASRFHHSEAVARLAKRIAKVHGADIYSAERAGLVHDCVKEWSPKKLLDYVKKKKLRIPDLAFIQKYSPNMMHAYAGSAWALEKGWITREQKSAVTAHTLASCTMSTLDKIIYIADFAAYDRKYKQAKKVRKMAMENIQQAFVMAMKFKIQFSLKKSKPVHPFAIEVWNHVCSRSY